MLGDDCEELLAVPVRSACCSFLSAQTFVLDAGGVETTESLADEAVLPLRTICCDVWSTLSTLGFLAETTTLAVSAVVPLCCPAMVVV